MRNPQRLWDGQEWLKPICSDSALPSDARAISYVYAELRAEMLIQLAFV